MPPITHPGINEPDDHGFFWYLWIALILGEAYIGYQGEPDGYKIAGIVFAFGIFWNLMRFMVR